MNSLVRFLFHLFGGKIATLGPTPQGKNIYVGQKFMLTKDLSTDLKAGVHVVTEYCGDRVFLKREDGQRFIPREAMPIYEIEILDYNEFQEIKRFC